MSVTPVKPFEKLSDETIKARKRLLIFCGLTLFIGFFHPTTTGFLSSISIKINTNGEYLPGILWFITFFLTFHFFHLFIKDDHKTSDIYKKLLDLAASHENVKEKIINLPTDQYNQIFKTTELNDDKNTIKTEINEFDNNLKNVTSSFNKSIRKINWVDKSLEFIAPLILGIITMLLIGFNPQMFTPQSAKQPPVAEAEIAVTDTPKVEVNQPTE